MTQSSLHIAIVMDGSGRWSEHSGEHQAETEALRRVVEAAPALGVRTLTAYAFSSDYWQRPAEEVEALMGLLTSYIEDETPELIAAGVRLSVIGRRDRLPAELVNAIELAESCTGFCTRMHLRLAIDYCAREASLRQESPEPAHLSIRMWPEFDAGDLRAAVDEFRRRDRRFGGAPAVAA